MTRLIVYGDSYADNTVRLSDRHGRSTPSGAWTDLLSRKLSLDQINRAVSGSSSQYAIKTFFYDVISNLIQPDDVIIFVLSTPGRMHFEFQNTNPRTASVYLHGSDDVWYKDNKKFLEWWMGNVDLSLEALNHDCYVHALKNFAATRPDVKVILLMNSDYDPSKQNSLPLGVLPNNFFKPDIFLNEISEHEIIGKRNYKEWTKVTTYDPRINHLSNPNLDILSDRVLEIIHDGDMQYFKYEYFQKNLFEIITTKEQYHSYIDHGLLDYDTNIHVNLV